MNISSFFKINTSLGNALAKGAFAIHFLGKNFENRIWKGQPNIYLKNMCDLIILKRRMFLMILHTINLYLSIDILTNINIEKFSKILKTSFTEYHDHFRDQDLSFETCLTKI